jgi:SLT domain-containing protein
MTTTSSTTREEYVTIIAATPGAAMAQFKARGLAAEGYAIAGPIGRHRFALVAESGTEELFAGTDLVAATFSRRVTA